MRRFLLSTEDAPGRDRFAYWHAAVTEGVFGMRGERGGNRDAPFAARLAGLAATSFSYLRDRSDGYPVVRDARVARGDYVAVYREIGAGVRFVFDRGELVTRAGDLLFSPADAAYALGPRGRYDYELWAFPRTLFDPHLPAPLRPHRLLPLDRGSGINRLIASYLEALAAELPGLDDAAAEVVADNFCRLLAIACGAAGGEQRTALRAARLDEVKRYVGLHLADPALTPERAAAALRLSVRQLHRLFEPSGTSFAQYLLQRRLEECRWALLRPATSGRAVTDIALGWGFNSLPTFYRTFRRAFGVAPGELRRAARQSP